MKKLKNKKVTIAVAVIIIVIIILLAFVLIKKDDSDELAQKETVKHDVVDTLYENIMADECTTLGNVNNENDAIIYMAFSMMKNDKILNDSINVESYNKAIRTVAGNKDVTFNEFVYGGYRYTLFSDKIIREKTDSCDTKYVSKLFGYSYSDDQLLVDVKFGYIKDDKVYNLASEEIGDYSEDTLNGVLDKGTVKTFVYDKSNKSYYLNSVK